MEYRFLVESAKIENASFPYKTAISEANVKTNKMVTTKWTYHKEWSFASNYFSFLKICFSLRTSYKQLICCTNNPNAHNCTFCKRWSFIWRCLFPASILKDTLKAFVDFKNKQQSVWSNFFWYVKVSILWKCIQCTINSLRQNTNIKKIPFGQNKWYKKCPLFSFVSSNSSQFYF